MQELLYQALKNNKELINLLGSFNISPVFSADIQRPSLVYTCTPLKHSLANKFTFEIKIIWSDYDLIKKIATILDSLLHFYYDSIFKPLGNYAFNSINTGGKATMWNDQIKMWEESLTYRITWKEV